MSQNIGEPEPKKSRFESESEDDNHFDDAEFVVKVELDEAERNYSSTVPQDELDKFYNELVTPKICPLCSKEFNYANSMKHHLEQVHLKIRMACSYCPFMAAPHRLVLMFKTLILRRRLCKVMIGAGNQPIRKFRISKLASE